MTPIKRSTKPTRKVLEALLRAKAGIWGLALTKEVNLPTGTVYPILGRLEELGWVDSFWDAASDRSGPRRKYYVLKDEAIIAAEEIVSEAVENRTGTIVGVRHA
jgi:PadR family transcriptional regulator, regulatory protein PadR